VGAAFPHIFGPPVIRKKPLFSTSVFALGGKVRKKETAQVPRIWISHFTVL
jgi:hypothetical protein